MRRRGCIISFCLALAIGAALLHISPAAAQLVTGAPGWFLIGTQSASSSSSLQFTGAQWSTSYNTLLLDCEGLFGSATGITLKVEVAEATAGWETGAHYVSTYNGVANATDLIDGTMLGMTTTGAPTYLQALIDNPGSSSIKKMIAITFGGGNSTTNGNLASGSTCCGYNTSAVTGGYNFYITGWWGADTNALTGIELVPSSGTISSGTCSLYGIQ